MILDGSSDADGDAAHIELDSGSIGPEAN